MKVAINNKIKCEKCGDIIESKYTHDFVWCSCKSCAVDGGLSYLKRCGDQAHWTDLSEFRDATREENEKFIKDNIDDYLMMLQDIDVSLIVEAIEEGYND